jgi:hypothetical protein
MPTSGDEPAFPSSLPNQAEGSGGNAVGLTKREYFAVHLFEGVVAKLSINCTLQDKANYAVEAADALVKALESER